jgi:hypothetical protein
VGRVFGFWEVGEWFWGYGGFPDVFWMGFGGFWAMVGPRSFPDGSPTKYNKSNRDRTAEVFNPLMRVACAGAVQRLKTCEVLNNNVLQMVFNCSS